MEKTEKTEKKLPKAKRSTHIKITRGERLLALNSKDEDEFYRKYMEVYPNSGRGITATLSIFKNRGRYKDLVIDETSKKMNFPIAPGKSEPDLLTLTIEMKNLLAEVIYYQKDILKLQQEKFDYIKMMTNHKEKDKVLEVSQTVS